MSSYSALSFIHSLNICRISSAVLDARNTVGKNRLIPALKELRPHRVKQANNHTQIENYKGGKRSKEISRAYSKKAVLGVGVNEGCGEGRVKDRRLR